MEENAFVCWVECHEPWIVEEQLINTLSLPLNLDQNSRHSFCSVLKGIRKKAADRAWELPVCVEDRFRREIQVYKIHLSNSQRG
jgi:hypothetical protein